MKKRLEQSEMEGIAQEMLEYAYNKFQAVGSALVMQASNRGSRSFISQEIVSNQPFSLERVKPFNLKTNNVAIAASRASRELRKAVVHPKNDTLAVGEMRYTGSAHAYVYRLHLITAFSCDELQAIDIAQYGLICVIEKFLREKVV